MMVFLPASLLKTGREGRGNGREEGDQELELQICSHSILLFWCLDFIVVFINNHKDSNKYKFLPKYLKYCQAIQSSQMLQWKVILDPMFYCRWFVYLFILCVGTCTNMCTWRPKVSVRSCLWSLSSRVIEAGLSSWTQSSRISLI